MNDIQSTPQKIGPALFFVVKDKILFHGCTMEEGEKYGNFINYPHSHFDIWCDNYEQKYKVDFDYYPRGRVVYRKTDDTFIIYYDKCLENQIDAIAKRYNGKNYILDYDEHYQCHMCNKNYI